MKKLILGILTVVVASGILMATDSSKRIAELSSQGFSAGYLVNNGMTALLAADGTAGIDTANRYQLQRKSMTVPITLASAGEDTVWTQLFTVPAGMTFYLEEILLSAHTEVSGTNDSSWGQILYYNMSSGASVLDTLVARFANDADSATYNDTTLSLTIVDATITAGDIVTFWQDNQKGAATGGEGAAITIRYRQDE